MLPSPVRCSLFLLDVRVARRSRSFSFRSAGKAVKSGHSCAAVTHHKPQARRFTACESQSAISVAGEGEGRGCACGAEVGSDKVQVTRGSIGQAALKSWYLILAPLNLRAARAKMRSPNICPGISHACGPSAYCRRTERENFIASNEA